MKRNIPLPNEVGIPTPTVVDTRPIVGGRPTGVGLHILTLPIPTAIVLALFLTLPLFHLQRVGFHSIYNRMLL